LDILVHTYIHRVFIQRKSTKELQCATVSATSKSIKYVFSFCLKIGNVRFGRRGSASNSFHNRGPAAVKLLSPNRLCVHGTDSIQMSLELERNGRRPISDSWLVVILYRVDL